VSEEEEDKEVPDGVFLAYWGILTVKVKNKNIKKSV